MSINQVAITGQEKIFDNEVHQVLVAFYRAFNEKNFELMQENWLNSKEIVMDNPLGGIKRGWGEIKTVYSRIFRGEAKVYVEFYDYTIIMLESGFCAVGRERGSVKIKEKRLDLAIRTSRIYKNVEGKYKQVHHHGSIETPELLKAYQSFVQS